MIHWVRGAMRSTFVVAAYCLWGVAACSDRVNGILPVDDAVVAVMITPPSAHLIVGDQVTLIATVVAGAGQRNRTVSWTTQNVAVALVDPNGVVTAVGGGTTNIVATSAADSSVKGTVPITVGSVGPDLIITNIKHDGVDVNLSNVVGQIDVGVALNFGTQTITKVDLLMTCAGVDTVVAVQTLATPTSSLTLSFNTAAYKNGPCGLKVRATKSTGVIVASSAVPITLNNPSTIAPTLGSEDLRDTGTRVPP
jgi:Bacterial surface proteins containing Ig-like domains